MDDKNKNTVKLHDKTFELSIPYQRLDEAIRCLAARLSADYSDKTPVFVCVLDGAFMFFSELMQKMEFPCEVAFVKVASYEGTASVGAVRELMGLSKNITDRHIVIVEDIVDSGKSIAHVISSLLRHDPASIEVATLFFKPEAYGEKFNIKYSALEIANDFIVGFGLDYDQLGRNLRDIYTIIDE